MLLVSVTAGSVAFSYPADSSWFPRVLSVFLGRVPDAPTILEAAGIAVPDIGAAVRGLVVPRGMMPERKQVLADAVDKLIADDDFIAHAGQVQLPLYFMSATEFRQYLAETDVLLDEYVQLLTDKL